MFYRILIVYNTYFFIMLIDWHSLKMSLAFTVQNNKQARRALKRFIADNANDVQRVSKCAVKVDWSLDCSQPEKRRRVLWTGAVSTFGKFVVEIRGCKSTIVGVGYAIWFIMLNQGYSTINIQPCSQKFYHHVRPLHASTSVTAWVVCLGNAQDPM